MKPILLGLVKETFEKPNFKKMDVNAPIWNLVGMRRSKYMANLQSDCGNVQSANKVLSRAFN